MAYLKVTCAIIVDGKKLLLAQRGEQMSLPLKWEFPGGKIREGESASDCLIREIKEELELNISIMKALPSSFHDYETFSLELLPHICAITTGTLTLHEHNDAVWLLPEKAQEMDLAEADIPVLLSYINDHR